MELRVNVDDQFIRNLQKSLGAKTPEIAKSALTMLSWAVNEVSKGRVILSSDEKGDNVHKLAMPTLDAVKKTEPQAAT
jgi:hypothetical protein